MGGIRGVTHGGGETIRISRHQLALTRGVGVLCAVGVAVLEGSFILAGLISSVFLLRFVLSFALATFSFLRLSLNLGGFTSSGDIILSHTGK